MKKLFLSGKVFIVHVILLLIFLCQDVYGQEVWSLKKDTEGIKIFTSKTSNSKFNLLKVECVADAKLTDLAALLLDVPDHVKWVYSTKACYQLKKVSDLEIYYYTQVHSPWPVKDRDLPVHLLITQDAGTKVMTIEADCVPNYFQAKEDIVRVPLSKAVWKVTPIGNNKIRINYQLKVDIGGSVPAWLFNMFITKGPYESFKALKERVQLPKYTTARLPSIIN
jgi:hypothetical protein